MEREENEPLPEFCSGMEKLQHGFSVSSLNTIFTWFRTLLNISFQQKAIP